MEKPNFIEIKKSEKNKEQNFEKGHTEALAFVEKHRDFFEHYAKGEVKIEPAPAGLKTFAFDLEKNTIYVNSMFYKERGFSDEKTLFAICHEIEHFLEKKSMLLEEGGEKKFLEHLKRIKSSKAYALIDNCNADIRENKSVILRTNEGMRDLEEKTYKEDLFPETDFTSEPMHIQFSQAFLREARVPDEKCKVSPKVREALDEVKNIKGLMDIMTNPETPMSIRLRLQNKYLWPKVENLLEKDIEEKNKQKQQEKNGNKSKKGNKTEKQKNKQKSNNKTGEKNIEETDPNQIFAEEYEKVEKKFPEAVPLEEIEKAFNEYKENKKNKNSKEMADEDYARKIGVKKEDLQNYRKTVESLEKIVNPETNVGVLEELKNLFLRIISKRIKKVMAPKYPMEEGEELVDPAQLVADVKSGNLQPKVWEDTEFIEKKGDKFGEVEITLVCDRSSSMEEGQKAEEQRKSAVLVMEALKEFAELCEGEKINVDKPLSVKSEIYSFSGSSQDKIPMKKMSAELGEAERINVLKKLYDLQGSTTDFNCLEAIDREINDRIKTKIEIGELKKIVIVLTDGESDSSEKVQAILKSLRDSGVVVMGIGITKEGLPVLSTYAPNALVVEDVAKLPVVLAELLKEHLDNI